MNGTVRTVALLSASPKTRQEEALSEYLARLAETRMNGEKVQTLHIGVREALRPGKTDAALEAARGADALVLFFPLYFFCLPSLLMRFLQLYERYLLAQGAAVPGQQIFAVVNCGFPEPEINGEAVRVVQSFARAIGARFGFGLLIGAGGMLLSAINAPFMRKTLGDINTALDRMRDAVLADAPAAQENVCVTANIPGKVYLFMGGIGWRIVAHRNGLRQRDLYRRPYRAQARERSLSGMNIGIIVLSNTGNTLQVAQRMSDALLAAGHTVKLERVTTAEDSPSAPAARKLKDAPDPTPYDAVVFGAPVWGFSLASVMKAYLMQIPSLGGKKVALFVTQGFPKPWMGGNHAIRQFQAACAQKAANVALTGIVNWSAPSREAQITGLVTQVAAL